MTATMGSETAPRGWGEGHRRVRAGDPAYFDALDFLVTEAEVLDENRYEDWLGMLDADIEYRMPTRATVLRADGDGFVGNMAHFDEDLASLTLRVRRIGTRTAWAEDPPSRAKRVVTNLRVDRIDRHDDELAASSYLLVLRSRWDSPAYEFILGERRDRLRRSDEAWKLCNREIRVEQSNLGTINMALFL
jgi:3-phenylpropionate/cinnamic acid dioxygenase small subunit